MLEKCCRIYRAVLECWHITAHRKSFSSAFGNVSLVIFDILEYTNLDIMRVLGLRHDFTV
jgi:hypothetical protein